MKKSLVALAVLAATGAYAQSSVTLYGIVEGTTDLGYRRIVESNNTVSGFAANGLATGTAPSFTAPTYPAAGGPIVFGAAVNSGTTSVRNEQKNGFRVQDGSDQGTGTSRVGFRGTEDLGSGLKANFQLEMGLRLDDGCTTLGGVVGPVGTAPTAANGVNCNNGGGSANSGGSTFGRNAWGGISGGFGEFRIGRQVLGSFDVQAGSTAGSSSLGLYETGAAFYIPIGNVRFSNALRYITPNIAGFSGSIMFAAPETLGNTSTTSSAPSAANGGNLVTTTTASKRTGVDIALNYANGPAYIGFGYNKRDADNNTAGVLAFNNAGTANTLGNNVKIGTITGYTIGGAYDLGVVKPFFNYTRQTTSTGRTDTLSTGSSVTDSSIATNGDATARGYSLGLRAPVGAFTIITSYGNFKTTGTNQSFASQASGSTSYVQSLSNRQTAFQLGAQYALSKRTMLEVNYGYSKLASNVGSTVTNSNVATNAGASGSQSFLSNDRISAFNVGMRHSF